MNNKLTDLLTQPVQPQPARALHFQAGRSRPRLLVLLLAVAVIGAGGIWWWKSRPDTNGDAASASAKPPAGNAGGRRFGGANAIQPVSIQTIRKQDIKVMVNAIGSVTASNTATVRAQVNGVLQRLNFVEGQQVSAGQLLAQIDPRAYEATLGQAEGALARDKAQLDNANIDLARYRDLLAKDAIPKQQLDTQQALVHQLEGTVKVDQAAVASAKLQLSYTRVLAPTAGRVGLKQVDIGNIVQTSDANGIVIINQTRPITLVFAVPSANVPLITARLRSNTAMTVNAWDRGGKRLLATGRVATVDNAIDTTTDTIKVKAVFANADDALFPNQAVSVTLQMDTLTDVLAVPPSAVLRGAQGFYLYVVNADNTVSTRVITPGTVDGDWMAIEGPLKVGEKVVIDGVDRLREGAKVEVIASDPKQRAGANAPAGGKRGRNKDKDKGADSSASGQASAAPTSAPASATSVTSAASAPQSASSAAASK
ncbi:MdtA/MuxA family multidrug efflux RND transporter periplasmic adaptor subunit [Undibacterium sp. Ji49W]|uniref:MdtA/MuxA family multidrug efflux RND transporter periplasmic adaptor subunit n=1 Tax=Undibacterium sp. Ji49W TaxID=3413040 RepID=UPI003BEF54B5